MTDTAPQAATADIVPAAPISPEIEAIFEQVQIKPVALDLEGTHYVLLSDGAFRTVLIATLNEEDDISHKRIPRDAGDVIVLTKGTFDNLTEVVNFMRT